MTSSLRAAAATLADLALHRGDPELRDAAQAVRSALATGEAYGVNGPEVRPYDEAIEAVRRGVCALPRYSFFLSNAGSVRRAEDSCGNWIEFTAAHELFDPVMVDALIANLIARQAVQKASEGAK